MRIIHNFLYPNFTLFISSLDVSIPVINLFFIKTQTHLYNYFSINVNQ